MFQNGVESATAEVIYNAIINEFTSVKIPKENIIGFGSDGCNTMMGKHNSVMSRFLKDFPGIYISKCICHSIHLCSSAASKELPRQAEDLTRDIYNFFKTSAKRIAVLKDFEDFCNTEPLQLLAPSQTRWLSLHPVVHRILHLWMPLVLFFTDFVSHEKLAIADRVLTNLMDPQIKLFFLFLDWVLPKFNSINAKFQTEKCILTSVDAEISKVFKELLCAFMDNSYVYKTDLSTIDVNNSAYIMKNSEIYLGQGVSSEIRKITTQKGSLLSPEQIEVMISQFKDRCRKFLQTGCVQIQNR